MGIELRSERIEWDEGPKLRDVGFGIEVGGEEERGLEPEWVGIKWVREQVRGGSRRCRCRDRIRHLEFEVSLAFGCC